MVKIVELFKIRRYLMRIMHAVAENDVVHDPYFRQLHVIVVFRLQHAL
jgi:hypothetical protein